MKYRLRHLTTYRYQSPVLFAQCTLVLTPSSDGHQQTQDAGLTITPKPKVLAQHRSFFGHMVATVEIDTPHRELAIESRATVTVERRPRENGPDLPWETVRHMGQSVASLQPEAPAHFLFPSSRIRLDDSVTAYARQSFLPKRNAAEAATTLMCKIKEEFRYDPDATRVSTPLIEAFEKKRGVCQDFAHIMIAGLRGLGLPARYVSGYIRTVPPAGQTRLEGSDATHAWVDVWCGIERGWVGFDPTNAVLVGNDHVVLATGRDYGDVAPVGGVLLGAGDQDVSVNVDLVPLAAEAQQTSVASHNAPAPA